MKTRTLIVLLTIMTTTTIGYSQQTDKEAISNVIIAFSKAGDDQNADALNKLLDSNYRIVMNQLFGSTEVSVMPKSVYLDKIRTKVFGGDQRKVTIEAISINGNTASAKVTLKGEKMTFISIFMLVKNASNEWLLVSDTPVIV